MLGSGRFQSTREGLRHVAKDASIRDVARESGVSVGTVSNVLNHPELVADATVRRVMEVMARLGFVRNDAARQLRLGHSRLVPLIVHSIDNPFYAELARGAEETAKKFDSVIVLADSDQNAANQDEYLDVFAEQRVRGLLIAPLDVDNERLSAFRKRGGPVVLVDHHAISTDFSSVSTDDVSGGYQAVRHLLETGRRRLAFVGGPATLPQVVHRLEGATRAAAEFPDAGLEVVTTEALSVHSGRQAGAELAARPAGERPDGIFAGNDLVAVGILQSLVLEARIRVPEDVALIGYDDIPYAAVGVVSLSSMRQPARLIGRTAVELLFEEIEEKGAPTHRRVVFAPHLVQRNSTRAPGA